MGIVKSIVAFLAKFWLLIVTVIGICFVCWWFWSPISRFFFMRWQMISLPVTISAVVLLLVAVIVVVSDLRNPIRMAGAVVIVIIIGGFLSLPFWLRTALPAKDTQPNVADHKKDNKETKKQAQTPLKTGTVVVDQNKVLEKTVTQLESQINEVARKRKADSLHAVDSLNTSCKLIKKVDLLQKTLNNLKKPIIVAQSDCDADTPAPPKPRSGKKNKRNNICSIKKNQKKQTTYFANIQGWNR